MQNLIKNGVDRPLYLLLALSLLNPVIIGLWSSNSMGAALLWNLLSAIVFSFISFDWYCRDSDAHGYRRSLMRNIGFNCFALFFVPYYLVRSRARGQKWRALLKLVGFGALLLIAMGIGFLLLAVLMPASR